MKLAAGHVFDKTSAVLQESLKHRLAKQLVLSSNIANAQTPGYRAMGYEFEGQLQAAIGNRGDLPMKTTRPDHIRFPGVSGDGSIQPDLFVRPTESIGNDGNTVDVDQEMAKLSENQILYRTTVELLNRRLGIMRYAITGGR